MEIRCDEMQLMLPFAIDAKGGERFKWEHALRGEHELLSSMTKGEIVGCRLPLMPTPDCRLSLMPTTKEWSLVT